MTRSALKWLAAGFLLFLYVAAWLAPFLAPYSPRHQFREFPFAPPSRISLHQGTIIPAPSFQSVRRIDLSPAYQLTGKQVPIRFQVESRPFTWMGLEFRTRLFGSGEAEHPLFLLGSDELGRDIFSRLLFGSRYSLSIGMVAILLTVVLGVCLGSLSGYLEGWPDRIVMRLSDLFLSLPGLFLVLALRATFPDLGGGLGLYVLIIVTFTLLGWASVARVVRGQVLTLKKREHVLYAYASGASHLRILLHHILPFTRNYLLVQSSVLLPAFIVGEVTLTFLGLGVQEPDVSWGNLLNDATSLRALSDFPWLLAPVLVTLLSVLAFNYAADELKLILDEEGEGRALGF